MICKEERREERRGTGGDGGSGINVVPVACYGWEEEERTELESDL